MSSWSKTIIPGDGWFAIYDEADGTETEMPILAWAVLMEWDRDIEGEPTAGDVFQAVGFSVDLHGVPERAAEIQGFRRYERRPLASWPDDALADSTG